MPAAAGSTVLLNCMSCLIQPPQSDLHPMVVLTNVLVCTQLGISGQRGKPWCGCNRSSIPHAHSLDDAARRTANEFIQVRGAFAGVTVFCSALGRRGKGSCLHSFTLDGCQKSRVAMQFWLCVVGDEAINPLLDLFVFDGGGRVVDDLAVTTCRKDGCLLPPAFHARREMSMIKTRHPLRYQHLHRRCTISAQPLG